MYNFNYFFLIFFYWSSIIHIFYEANSRFFFFKKLIENYDFEKMFKMFNQNNNIIVQRVFKWISLFIDI